MSHELYIRCVVDHCPYVLNQYLVYICTKRMMRYIIFDAVNMVELRKMTSIEQTMSNQRGGYNLVFSVKSLTSNIARRLRKIKF